ncbi:MAG: flagellar hook-associated protein FlgL [Ramlibacter sp.]|nr:flagellar hook-associated protein FlgL [Ramlibacter sp.]
MRVPTLQMSRASFDAVRSREAEQAKLQSRIASGLRVQSPGDDPVAAAQAELARSRLASITQDRRANQLSASVLATADGALSQGVDMLQSAREALVGAGNGAYSASDRASLADHLSGLRDQLLLLANSSDGAGGFVFGGQGAASAPLAGVASPAYAPAAGDQRIGEGGRYAATVDGQSVFMSLAQGNGVFVTGSAGANTGSGWIGAGAVTSPAQLTGHAYSIAITGAPGAQTYTATDTTLGTAVATGAPFTPGAAITVDGQQITITGAPASGDAFTLAPAAKQSVFQTLDDAISLLRNTTLSKPAYNQGLEGVQAGIDRALDGMVLARTHVGEQMQSVDRGADTANQQELSTTQRRSDLEDMDVAAGISQLQNSQVGLQAALQSYAGIAKTSLFQYIT